MDIDSFKTFHLGEGQNHPLALVGSPDLSDFNLVSNINASLAQATCDSHITPYVGLERVRKALAYYSIQLPRYTFLDGEAGDTAFDVIRFGYVSGVNLDGTQAKTEDTNMYVYFAYALNDSGMFDIYCELVSSEELEELLTNDEEIEEDAGSI
jgi:nitric oxide synthase oxygenase domain/subunit